VPLVLSARGSGVTLHLQSVLYANAALNISVTD
jgi:hypothetical protein